MAKTTKGGRIMNPTDAARKQARKKEIARNKLERDMQRATPKEVPEISKRLGELLEEEEAAKSGGKPISRQLHIKRKVLQDAMKLAVAKERVRAWTPPVGVSEARTPGTQARENTRQEGKGMGGGGRRWCQRSRICTRLLSCVRLFSCGDIAAPQRPLPAFSRLFSRPECIKLCARLTCGLRAPFLPAPGAHAFAMLCAQTAIAVCAALLRRWVQIIRARQVRCEHYDFPAVW